MVEKGWHVVQAHNFEMDKRYEQPSRVPKQMTTRQIPWTKRTFSVKALITGVYDLAFVVCKGDWSDMWELKTNQANLTALI